MLTTKNPDFESIAEQEQTLRKQALTIQEKNHTLQEQMAHIAELKHTGSYKPWQKIKDVFHRH